MNDKIKHSTKAKRMNEADTRAELIDPKLKACGWGVVADSKVLRVRNVFTYRTLPLFGNLT